jgi:hypothetical protein
MKQLILLKRSNRIQLAHLYEHIFCGRLIAFMQARDLYQNIDYHLDAKTYNGGIIRLQVDLYVDRAVELAQAIPTLAIDFTEDDLLMAANQLFAEDQEPVGGAGYLAVKKGLERLHGSGWETIDQFEDIDTKGLRRYAHPFYTAEGPRLPARKLHVALVLDQAATRSHRALLPLFQQLSGVMMANITSDLCDVHGYYSVEDVFKVHGSQARLSNLFRVGHADVTLGVDRDIALGVVAAMDKDGAFQRFVSQLRNVSYFDWEDFMPDEQQVYEDTLIFIGAKGWQKIATVEHCELLLKHMSVELRFGRETVVARVRDSNESSKRPTVQAG